MQALANVFNTLLEGLLLIAYACAMGGLAWSLLLFRDGGHQTVARRHLTCRGVMLMRWGSLGLAAMQLAKLATHAWLLAETFQRWPFPDYLYTLQCQAGLSRALLAGGLWMAGGWLERRPRALLPWTATGLAALLLGANAAWLSHAVGRSEARVLLMTVTALHQFAVAIWLGGIIQLGLFWRLICQQPHMKPLWLTLVKRFAWIGAPAALGVMATGLPLAWKYIGTWQGLIGTDYGAMVLIKVVLLVATLSFAGLNCWVARNRHTASSLTTVFQRLPSYLEAETLLLIAILFAAVSLSTQPPAVDMRGEQATWTELYEVFRPKVPRLLSPASTEAGTADSDGAAIDGNTSTGVGTSRSDYNHNVSGLFLIAMALAALASRAGWMRWTRHWPLGFVGLSIFVVLQSDAASSWPFGPTGFWEGVLSNDEILLHRLGALIACMLGFTEWRVHTHRQPGTYVPYVLPMLCGVGGILLLGHAHEGFQPKEEFLIQITHNVIGMLAVAMACSRWLELRQAAFSRRRAGMVSALALLLIGLILLFYRETTLS
jgi:copper resistance protein D